MIFSARARMRARCPSFKLMACSNVSIVSEDMSHSTEIPSSLANAHI